MTRAPYPWPWGPSMPGAGKPPEPRKTNPATCRYCKGEFRSTGGRAHYCSRECRELAARARR